MQIRSVFKDRWNTHGKDVLAMEKEVQSTVINVAVMEERTCVEVRISPRVRKRARKRVSVCLGEVCCAVMICGFPSVTGGPRESVGL